MKKYRYPQSSQVFKLKEIDRWIYRFECGHWCTDIVFKDLIEITSEGEQLKLNL